MKTISRFLIATISIPFLFIGWLAYFGFMSVLIGWSSMEAFIEWAWGDG